MVRWPVLLVSFCLLLGPGCGGDQSSDATSQDSPSSADTAEVVSASSDEANPKTNGDEDGASSTEETEVEAGTTSATDTSDAPSSASTLTDAQKKRIGPRLQRLIRDEKAGLQPVGQRGQAAIYEVIIRCDDPDALRKADIPLSSMQGNLITARLTIDQILKTATVDAVGGIQAAKEYQMHDEDSGGAQRRSVEGNQGGR